MTEMEELFWSFCSTDHHHKELLAPFSGHGMVMASDAHVMIATPVDSYDGKIPREQTKLKDLQTLIHMLRTEPIFAFQADQLAGSLQEKLIPETEECEQCEGSGLIKCDCCGSFQDCNNCNGTGELESTDKLIPDPNQLYDWRDKRFSISVIKALLKVSEYAKESTIEAVFWSREAAAACFQIGQFWVVLMPVWKDKKQEAIIINLPVHLGFSSDGRFLGTD